MMMLSAGVGQHGRGQGAQGVQGGVKRLRQEALQPRRGPRQVRDII